MIGCTYHPAVAAGHECEPCGAYLCGACLFAHKDGVTSECARCGALLLPIVERLEVVKRGPVSTAALRADATQPLVDRLPRTWAYLRRPSVIATMAGMAILHWLASFMGLYLVMISAGLTAGYFFLIVETSARGAQDLEAPDFTDFWAAILGPLLRMVATVLPIIVIWAVADVPLDDAIEGGARAWIGQLGLWVVPAALWLFLWPLLILAAAISRSIVATFNPLGWVRVLREMGKDYLVGAGLFYAITLVATFVVAPLGAWILRVAPIPVIVPLLVHFMLLIPLTFQARVLGEAARPYVDV